MIGFKAIRLGVLFGAVILSSAGSGSADVTPEDDGILSQERESMVEYQLRKRGIRNERVLDAMAKVERHQFVPKTLLMQSYQDSPLPIGYGQTISQPFIVAYMTEALGLAGDEKVLEIGTGSGYQAAILGELAEEVYTLEIIPELGRSAVDNLRELGYENIHVKIGDGYEGWPERQPFDAILLTAAPNAVPQALIDQLKIGGRMVVPVGEYDQELMLIHKTTHGVKKKTLIPVRFVPMVKK